MNFEEALEYAETIMQWRVDAGPNRVNVFAMRLVGNYTPDEFVRVVERYKYIEEKIRDRDQQQKGES